ncbi:DEDD exonuclease domain-containing protein [Granulicoccus phenolivorans]|uniref:DEDD exonuclease domain-containing protein n=1 Tax=Granulicoccus phenolivorans TaxID=266854 RepID=UPI0004135263|nr:DEDD exonuclease domain-containing protein [Granulicoccus phenolivorans]
MSLASLPHTRATAAADPAYQPSFEELGTPLSEVTFCVVDLETTGGGAEDTITEIGAVKVRGGEVCGEFQTLVNPNTTIAPLIQVLTGITNQMVADAPSLSASLPGFLEFARGTVLVAHNAAFDIGHLKRACADRDTPWPGNQVLDTLALARCILLRDEVPNFKLGTLAAHVHSTVEPNHRALSDARATVDVLHALIERVGSLGVHSLEDLREFTRRVPRARRAKRGWADALPAAPGVYLFHHDHPDPEAPDGVRREVLYVGKSGNLQRRVRSYFTASEKRARINEMVQIATGVSHVVCHTELHAEVTELRMIATHAPRYNRRSKNPHRATWLRLTDELFPRLSLVRTVTADGVHLGPFRSRRTAEEVRDALHDAFRLRQCTDRIPARQDGSPCALAGMGRCPAPCDGSVSPAAYARIAGAAGAAMAGDVAGVNGALTARITRLADAERFEEAGQVRDRMLTWAESLRRFHRFTALARCRQLVATAPVEGGWAVHVIRYGRLAAAGLARPGEHPPTFAAGLVTTAESVPAPSAPLPAATVAETECLAGWLERPGVRLLEVDGEWSWPLHLAE